MLNSYLETGSVCPSTPYDRSSDILDDGDNLYAIIKDGKNKKFICIISECQKVFRFHSEMQRHIASHSTFRPHKCTFDGCNREFKRSSALENHIRSQHTGEAPLLCPYPGCAIRFSTEAKYRYHIVSHLDEKPHKCAFPKCTKSFMTLSQLKQHEKSPSVHKKLDMMTQLEENDKVIRVSSLDTPDGSGRSQRDSLIKVEPTKKVKYDVQNKRLSELLSSLKINSVETEKQPTKVEDTTEPALDIILTENELLRRKLESSEQMLEEMKKKIGLIHTNMTGAHQLPPPPSFILPEVVASNDQERDMMDGFFNREVDSYLIHDPCVIDPRPYMEDNEFVIRSDPLEGNLADDKLSFYFTNFAFDDFPYSPSRQIEQCLR